MKTRTTLYLFTAVGLIWLAGCGGGAPAPQIAPNDVSAAWPGYMENLPDDPSFFLASATATSQDPQMAVSKAELNAQGQLATRLSAVIQDRMTTMNKEAGSGDAAQFQSKTVQATERCVNQVHNGIRTREKKYLREGTGFRGFVLVEIPRVNADEALFGTVKKDDDLYQRFLASKSFQDLEAHFR